MKTIVYYISDYGYGHASRSIAVIRNFLNRTSDVRVIICNSFAIEFLKESLVEYGERVVYHEVKTDIGYVLKKDSIEPDPIALKNRLSDYYHNWEEIVENELEYFKDKSIVGILSDISPIGIEVGSIIDVPTIGISNFTWYSAYKDLLKEQELEKLRKSYEQLDYYFSLATNQEKWGRVGEFNFSFFSRTVDLNEVNRIRQIVNPSGNKKIIFVGIGMKIDMPLMNLPIWSNAENVYIVSANVQAEGNDIFKIPFEYTESQNYIAASDIIITKAGWGTVSEAVNQGKTLYVIDRQSLNEDRNTISYLKQYNLAETITLEKLYSINDLTIRNEVKCENEVELIVNKICEILNLKFKQKAI
ncbi:glycosyltransferase [Bacillus sp. UNCCL81]|uniref:glycosyltransferase n=1 Tax=Bacillus sp. UNCCL81 TaxID=1502755 RepID=UPI0008E1A8F4|nr:glycosyltransferase [Bacillus sp. UNCCL81]SFD10112.1 UDP:flavonoid glycosyltransferase YjiC, YdhE family [Bacillus sp. UNCCL81]